MTKAANQRPAKKYMILLSQLLLTPRESKVQQAAMQPVINELLSLTRADFDELLDLANSNHVVMRGMEIIEELMREAGDDLRAGWAQAARDVERERISIALKYLEEICLAFEQERMDVTVIKSLDHWPDLGSDLDLYSNAAPEEIVRLMKRKFNAKVSARSWGDRLAQKVNFEIPGLPEAVEIHMGRLGQTGEQTAIASRLMQRTRRVLVGSQEFRVTSVSDRIMISTLQRMYRHFYFRLCDVIDSAGLADAGAIDYFDLRQAAQQADIWEGVATYMVIVSDYVKQYRGWGLDLPQTVIADARFGGDQIFYAKEFLRVPILPQSAKLYGSQLAGLLRKREIESGARLSLLPWLATAALVGMKITGSDKGIW